MFLSQIPSLIHSESVKWAGNSTQYSRLAEKWFVYRLFVITKRRPVAPVGVLEIGIGIKICPGRAAVLVVKNIFDNAGRFTSHVIAGVREERQQQHIAFVAASTITNRNEFPSQPSESYHQFKTP